MRFEFFIPGTLSETSGARQLMTALIASAVKAGDDVRVTDTYKGIGDVLVLYGVGADNRAPIRDRHVKSGRRAILWDLGYFGPGLNRKGYLRCSIDHDHPQAWLAQTPPDPSRWDALNIPLREDKTVGGTILLIGLGRKSRRYLNEPGWEAKALSEILDKYLAHPSNVIDRIIYRPKPNHPSPLLKVRTDDKTPIHELLKGAEFVVCRHSNVAVDAAIAGVPFDCEDGAAMWLRDKPFTRANRLDFLRRLAWWQWRADETDQAWAFLSRMLQHEAVAA